MSKNREDALKAFEALAHDVVQFDDHPPIDPERHDNGLFSQKVRCYGANATGQVAGGAPRLMEVEM